jgi:hypothetical protein
MARSPGDAALPFADRVVDVGAGETVFVAAGVADTYEALEARYLVSLTPPLVALIDALQRTRDPVEQRAIYEEHMSELLE